ncbi:MAG: hypothetical protein PVG78_05285 [Desulfobacterales bacterium]
MTEGPKKTEEKPRKPEKRRSVSESVRRQEIKVVELGVTEDEKALMEEISVQIDNLAGAKDARPAEPAHPKAAADPAKNRHRTDERPQPKTASPPPAKAPAARRRQAASSAGKEAAGNGNAAEALSARQKLDEARRRSAQAARRARRKKSGKKAAVFIVAGAVILVLGAVGAYTVFKPGPRPEPQKPIKFSVENVPGIKIETPAAAEPDKVTAPGEGSVPVAPTERAPAPLPPVEKPASVPATPGKGAVHEKMQSEINAFLVSWVAAWEASAGPNGRIDPYIAHFSRYFRDGAMDLADWRADKAVKNRRKKWIRIDIRNVRIFEPGADGTVRVRFLQNYESANYRDSTEKTLVLDREGGQWKIIGFGGESDNR